MSARGAQGVVISNRPSGNDELGLDDDPFRAAAVDEGLPVAVHINVVSRAQRAARHRVAATPPMAPKTARPDATGAQAIGAISNVFAAVAGSLTRMLFTGTFERFRELHVTWIEAGVGWWAHLLDAIDDRYWRRSSSTRRGSSCAIESVWGT